MQQAGQKFNLVDAFVHTIKYRKPASGGRDGINFPQEKNQVVHTPGRSTSARSSPAAIDPGLFVALGGVGPIEGGCHE
jgi:hypothetical protein